MIRPVYYVSDARFPHPVIGVWFLVRLLQHGAAVAAVATEAPLQGPLDPLPEADSDHLFFELFSTLPANQLEAKLTRSLCGDVPELRQGATDECGCVASST